jgi:acyl carrier protein
MMVNVPQIDGRGTVRELLSEVAGSQAIEHIADDDQLFERMLLDSLQLITLVSSLEERFRVVVAPEDLIPENFESIAAIAEFIASKTPGA